MPEASIASITSPEHGAQQECSSTLRWPPGNGNGARVFSLMGPIVLTDGAPRPKEEGRRKKAEGAETLEIRSEKKSYCYYYSYIYIGFSSQPSSTDIGPPLPPSAFRLGR